MFSERLRTLIAAALFACAVPAIAQSVESEGLGQVDPWGSGYIARGDGAFASDLWSGSRSEDLIPLMRRTATAPADRMMLTPVEHALLRRVLLSPAARPQGSPDGLMEERIRMMRAIGEIEPAIDLMRRTGDPAALAEADRLTTDMALARGDVATACAGAEKAPTDDPYNLKVRAVCFALANDSAGAELSLELAASAGVDDPWLVSAVLAAIVDTPNKPPAHLGNGLAITASLAASLKAPVNVMDGVAPHYALALAAREELPAQWRVLAAGISAEAGLADPEDVRRAFRSLVSDPEFAPGSALTRAMQVLDDRAAPPGDRARAFSDALRSAAGRPERFASVSAVLAPGIEALPRNGDTRPRALIFARAAIARGDMSAATRWLRAAGQPRADETEAAVPAFEIALTEAMILLARGERSGSAVDPVVKALTDTALTPADKAAAARLLALMNALGQPLGPQARALMAEGLVPAPPAPAPQKGKTKPKPAEPVATDTGEILRISALTGSDTGAELVLRLIRQTRGQPDALPTRDAVALVDTLRRAGLDADARRLALETMKYWQVGAG